MGICACGRTFTLENAFTNHTRTCLTSKKRLSSALEGVKAKWTVKKRRRLAVEGSSSGSTLDSTGLIPLPSVAVDDQSMMQLDQSPHDHGPDDSHLTLVQRKPWNNRTNRQLPRRFRDALPQTAPAIPSPVVTDPAESPPHNSPNKPATLHTFTSFNAFGLFRRYEIRQTFLEHDPDEYVSLIDLSNIPTRTNVAQPTFSPYPNRSSFLLGDWYWNGGVQKSQQSFNDLIKIITDPEFQITDIQNVNWTQINEELASDNAGEWLDDDAGWTRTPVSLSIPYQIRRGILSDVGAGPRDYLVGDFHHRNLISIIREKINGLTERSQFHFEPYVLLWQKPGRATSVRVQGELYSSLAWIKAHRDLQDLPRESGCKLERVVVALMFWSDATHLTMFGDAKLWPLYLFFGNDTKYHRCKPSCHLCEHVAYFQSLPDAFKEFASFQTAGKKAPSTAFMTHCHRELLHEQWKILLDDEFLEAWTHGIVIECWDGIKRRFYPRIFDYSADYPEKILLASIRNLGRCPCPRCLIPLDLVHNLGMPRDMMQRVSKARVDGIERQNKVAAARRFIYERNMQVNSTAVEALLRDWSGVPTTNAFSARLSPLGFNIHEVLLPDLLHEVELGGWKAIFIHLLRMLESLDVTLLVELDRRYRDIPAFGRDSIRRFSSNSSEMKKMTARNFENLLQCAIPVFEGLFPEPHNRVVMDLLFTHGHWHGLAKLRMHHDITLDILDAVTKSLGEKLRNFSRNTCPAFDTVELRREQQARTRREARNDSCHSRQNAPLNTHGPCVTRGLALHSSGSSSANLETSLQMQCVQQPRGSTDSAANDPSINQPSTSSDYEHDSLPTSSEQPQCLETARRKAQSRGSNVSVGTGRRRKKFNVNTYKFHSYGDYANTIRIYGTTDSFSTELGELEHRSPKSRYQRTSKKCFVKQLTQIERRQARIRRIIAKHQTNGGSPPTFHEDTPVTPESRHIISDTQNMPENIPLFLQNNANDPAVQNFLPKLRAHILPRIRTILEKERADAQGGHVPGVDMALDPALRLESDTTSVLLKNDRMYRHHLARFNYTTYDVRRAQDVINPNTPHCNIMLLADNSQTCDETHHPFLYARVLGIYHVNVVYTGQGSFDYAARQIKFLWVRWFKPTGTPVKWGHLRLDSISFPPMAQDSSFGFVDPSDVLRSCHIIPAFASGKVHSDSISLSRCANDGSDYRRYYVNRFADRDMLMRYHWGLGIGHLYSHEQDNTARKTSSRPSSATDWYDIDQPESELPAYLVDSDTMHHGVADGQADDSGSPEDCLEDLEDDLLGMADEDVEEDPQDDETQEMLEEMFGQDDDYQ